MATVGEVTRYLDQKAPFAWQLDFDNAGFLVGRENNLVTKILVALDITFEVIQEAIEKHAELIVAHHPVIWGQISSVTDQDQTGQKLLKLISADIAAICAHTNLDAAEGGVNSELARRLGLINTSPIKIDGVDENGTPYGIGRVGERQDGPVALPAFLEEVKTALKAPGLRVMNAGWLVHKVAVGGGACGSMLGQVAKLGCDTFVTSEIKHDLYLEAQALGVNLIDAGHFSTEAVICPVLVDWLKKGFPTLAVEVAQGQGEVFRCY